MFDLSDVYISMEDNSNAKLRMMKISFASEIVIWTRDANKVESGGVGTSDSVISDDQEFGRLI